MVDQTIALQVRPLDVATPLLQAARIKQSQMEQQQQQINMQRDAIGAEARGLAPYVGSPDYADRVQASKARLVQQGIITNDQQAAGFDRDFGSPLGLKSIIERTQDPRLGLMQQQYAESVRHAKATEAQSAAQLAEMERSHRAAEEQGKIVTSVNPLTMETTYSRITPRGLEPLNVLQPPGGPQPPIAPSGGAAPGAGAVPLPAPGSSAAPTPGGSAPAPAVPGPQPGKLTADQLRQKYGAGPDDPRNWDYLASLPPPVQERVFRTATYDVNPANYPARTVTGAPNSARGALTDAAAQFDKTYSTQNYPIIQQVRTAFDKGPEGRVVRSLNVVTDHLATYRDLAIALKNGNIQLFNSLAQKLAEATGSAAPTNLKAAGMIVGPELVKALGVANAGSAGEREELGRLISTASSPAQALGAIDDVARPMLTGQLRGLRQQFTSSGRGYLTEKEFNDKLFPATIKFMEGHGKPAAGGAPATLKPGKYNWTPDGGLAPQ